MITNLARTYHHTTAFRPLTTYGRQLVFYLFTFLHFYLFTFSPLYLFTACTPTRDTATVIDKLPPIYPDYTDVTIPVNIAPMNFLVRGDNVKAVEAVATCGDDQLTVRQRGASVTFDLDDWKDFLGKAAGKTVSLQVYSCDASDKWTEWKTFSWQVANDSIDPWLSYRLIEPDYEVWSNVAIEQRCVENFETTSLSDYQHAGDKCMNCHVYDNSPRKEAQEKHFQRSMLYVRGEGGGAFLSEDGHLRKLNIKTPDMVSGSVYYGFSPTGRYITFSTNVIIPAFHSDAAKRLEVYDTKSDVYCADLRENRIIRSPLVSDSTQLETFPTFSPDGQWVYFCTAPLDSLRRGGIKSLHYSLCRIAFDSQKGTFGTQIDTLFRGTSLTATADGGSVCHPRISPDGRHILFTVQDYGTFPIWHREADLRMMDLQTGKVDSLSVVNSDKSDTYHSWSSNSRWFVFASKRDDGLYGKPYFCYVDRQGRAHKPFVLPQRDPTKYDNTLKSYNAPELGQHPAAFSASDVAGAMRKEAEPFK